MIVLYILLLLVAIFINYYFARQFEQIAIQKGYTESKYFHFCFWLGLIGYLLVTALPDKNLHASLSAKNTYIYHTADTLVDNGIDNDDQKDAVSQKSAPKPKRADDEPPATPIKLSGDDVACPFCGKKPKNDRNFCWSCGQRFSDA